MTEPVKIDPEALYDDRVLRSTLGLNSSSLAAARRSGKLRFCRHGHQKLYRGGWVLDWLEASATPATPPVQGVAS